jgi:hypothetical protein
MRWSALFVAVFTAVLVLSVFGGGAASQARPPSARVSAPANEKPKVAVQPPAFDPQADCHHAPFGEILFPGPPLSAWYSQIKSDLPLSPECENPETESCYIKGASGYLFGISMLEDLPNAPGGRDRYLFKKVARPENGARLPLGIAWSDQRETIQKKLRVAGLDLDFYLHKGAHEFASAGCFIPPDKSEPFAMIFQFQGGKLVEVEQGVSYP